MKIRALSAAVIALAFAATLAVPAQASDAVYPSGMRVGLVPIEGLVPAKDFAGFVSTDQNVKIGVTELPEAAFEAVNAAVKEGKVPAQGPAPEPFETPTRKGYFTSEAGKDGAVNVHNFSVLLPGEKFSGYVIAQVREGAEAQFSEAAIRKMFATTVLRSEVPVEEQLGLLAFKVGDLAGFKNVRTIAPRSAVLLSDGTPESTVDDGAPYMMIGVLQGTPTQSADRSRFAEQVATTIPGLRNARITSNEPMRIEGTAGFETRIEAISGKNDTPIRIIQWLRFANGGSTLRIVASVSKEEWPQAFPRFRAVRDGIGPRAEK